MDSPEISEVLQKCELFGTLGEEDMEQIARACEVRDYENGDRVIEQNERGDKIYLIAKGQIALLRTVDCGERELTRIIELLGPGRGFGSSTLLYGSHSWTASAECQRPTKVLCMDGAMLRTTLDERPQMGFIVMRNLAKMISKRLRAAYDVIDTLK